MTGLRRSSQYSKKVVLITGASAGIGAAVAREFALQGADLVLAARRTDRLEALAQELQGLGRRVLVTRCDVTQDGDLERVVQAGVSTLGKIDIVVANAGFGVTGSIANLKLEDYRRQFETNVFGVLRTVYASLDELKKNRGSLVLLGSVAGYVSLPGSSPYSMSKFSIHALADAITPELKVHGVSVVLIAPGFVTSEIREVDNRGHYRPGRGEPLPAWLPMRTDRAARQLVEAVTRGRRGLKVRVITWHGKMVVWLQRYCPWVIAYAVNRGLRARKEPSISD